MLLFCLNMLLVLFCAYRYFTKRGSVTVELGNKVIVESLATQERIDIHVTDTKNPFYMKQINDIVLIRGEKYKIITVKKRL